MHFPISGIARHRSHWVGIHRLFQLLRWVPIGFPDIWMGLASYFPPGRVLPMSCRSPFYRRSSRVRRTKTATSVSISKHRRGLSRFPLNYLTYNVLQCIILFVYCILHVRLHAWRCSISENRIAHILLIKEYCHLKNRLLEECFHCIFGRGGYFFPFFFSWFSFFPIFFTWRCHCCFSSPRRLAYPCSFSDHSLRCSLYFVILPFHHLTLPSPLIEFFHEKRRKLIFSSALGYFFFFMYFKLIIKFTISVPFLMIFHGNCSLGLFQV